jgi:hypothetical protein
MNKTKNYNKYTLTNSASNMKNSVPKDGTNTNTQEDKIITCSNIPKK